MYKNMVYSGGKTKWGTIVTFLLVFLFLPPIFGLPIVIGYVWMSKAKSKTDYYVLMLCIAAYLGAINATKTPSGDQVNYFMAYENVPNIGFWKSLIYIYGTSLMDDPNRTMISGEFMNGVYNYFGYYLTFGYYPLFEFLLTIASYMLIFTGLYKFCITLKKPHFPIVCGVLILSFFYLYFQFTLQIQKQLLAQAIMMYAIGDYAYRGTLSRRAKVAMVCAIFTHQSMLFFVPFIILKRFRTKMNKPTIAMVLVILGLFIYFGPRMLGGGSEQTSNVMMYGVNRFAQSETNNDEAGGVSMIHVIVIALPLAIICMKRMMGYQKHFVASQSFMVLVVLLILVTVFSMSRQPTSQYRFFMMLMPFMPFIYPLAFKRISWRNYLLIALSFVMIGWFYLQFSKIVWHYAPEMDILVKSPIILIATNYAGV